MLLNTLFGPPRRRGAVSGNENWWPEVGTRRKSRAGVDVDEETALTYAACWCATRVIAETTAGLPLITYERQGRDRDEADELPLYDLLRNLPNPDMGRMAFWEGRTAQQVNYGNGFAEIERESPGDPRSPIVALWPIHASRVRRSRSDDTDRRGRPLSPDFRYVVKNNDRTEIAMRADEILHIPGVLSDDGIWGRGVIAHARETIGLGLAVERHAAAGFGAGNMPRAVVFAPGLKEKEARRRFRQEWREIHGSPDASEVAILGTDAKLQTLGMSNDDAQFVLTRSGTVDEIARFYRLPPHTIMSLMRSTNNNIEQQGMDLVIYGLFPWTRRIEETVHLRLMTREERRRFFVEHQWGQLLKGDTATRFASYVQALSAGFLTINEVRRLENLPGIGPAGDQNYVPVNLTTAQRLLMDADAGDPTAESAPVPAAPPPALPPAPPHGPGTAGAADAERRLAVVSRSAARQILTDTLRRLNYKEAAAARRAVEAKADVDRWVADWAPRHRETMAQALAPVAGMLAVCGLDRSARDLAEWLSARNTEDLCALFGQPRSALDAALDDWPGRRAERLADAILDPKPTAAAA